MDEAQTDLYLKRSSESSGTNFFGFHCVALRPCISLAHMGSLWKGTGYLFVLSMFILVHDVLNLQIGVLAFQDPF